MIFVAILINISMWVVIGYVFGSYFARYTQYGNLLSVAIGTAGALIGGFISFLAYGLPNLILWPNNLLFAIVGSLGAVYISLPEEERAQKLEEIVRSFKKLNEFYIDLVGIKQ